MKLNSVEVDLSEEGPLELMHGVAGAYVARFGEEPEDPGGWYEPYAWRRISRVFERIDKGGDVLDVGTGAGQFVNCLALSEQFRSVTTTDPTRFRKYIELSEDINRYDFSIADLKFDDDSFDVVTCMEVLEHLPEEIFLPAISELRRVCRGQLVITVPYSEPEPLSKTHVRRFEDEDFARLFPHADFTLLRRPRKPWMMVEERPNDPVRRVALEVDEEVEDLQAQVEELEGKVASLRNRRVVRMANWLGRRLR